MQSTISSHDRCPRCLLQAMSGFSILYVPLKFGVEIMNHASAGPHIYQSVFSHYVPCSCAVRQRPQIDIQRSTKPPKYRDEVAEIDNALKFELEALHGIYEQDQQVLRHVDRVNS
ncbi:hypothetical protein HGRIS_002762 [Hohenbuehelia grisea]|uniref:Uncharacterized protein n=1 Tax=Hohenbuehelia grisea TaxID=104357 RepID=A0ABR3JMQ6_9AGAR